MAKTMYPIGQCPADECVDDMDMDIEWRLGDGDYSMSDDEDYNPIDIKKLTYYLTRWKRLLMKIFPGVRFSIYPSEGGRAKMELREVVVLYDDSNNEQEVLAYNCIDNLPTTWEEAEEMAAGKRYKPIINR